MFYFCKSIKKIMFRVQGIWFLLFPDRENTGNFVLTQEKICQHMENIINIKSMFIFLNFKNF